MLPEKLLQLLNEHKVTYLVIGATAMAAHGYIRATKDIDILILATKKNAANTMKALQKFGYDISDLTVDEVLAKKILFRGYWLETDIHPDVKGVTNFEVLWKNRLEADYKGTPAYFASLNDLIKMKRAAGRPKDKVDLDYLINLKKQAEQAKKLFKRSK